MRDLTTHEIDDVNGATLVGNLIEMGQDMAIELFTADPEQLQQSGIETMNVGGATMALGAGYSWLGPGSGQVISTLIVAGGAGMTAYGLANYALGSLAGWLQQSGC